MLRWLRNKQQAQRGDTLIEVTIALAILGFVLLGATAIAAMAFRTGQTARERTQVAATAQEQLEALRSFRDNHTWGEFRTGKNCGASGGFCGVDQVLGTVCTSDASKRCFHMVLANTAAGTTEWVPQTGPGTSNVPTSVVEISTATSVTSQCAYDFLLFYQFQPVGGGTRAKNEIATRLANLRLDSSAGSVACP
jgi:prepilin-type N-terminal cleavage/methylation domain-containing protein